MQEFIFDHLTVKHDEAEKYQYFSIKGDLDTVSCSKVQKEIIPLVVHKKPLILDLRHLTYISSTGVGLLVEMAKISSDIRLTGIQERPKEVLMSLGFLRFFKIYETLEKAEKSIK